MSDPYAWAELARYNGECSRGIVHTKEWDARMAIEQANFNEANRPGRADDEYEYHPDVTYDYEPPPKRRRWKR